MSGLDLADIFILIATGVAAGFAGGMMGLGGAFIMTPLQIIVYTGMGVDPDIATKTAFGTSLLVVFSSAVSGSWRHHRQGSVKWRVALTMGICGLVFGLIGSTFSSHIPGSALRIVFGTVSIASCIRMFFTAKEQSDAVAVSNPWIWAAWAVPVGLLSGLLGVGGGILMIPIMVVALKFKMREAVANSLAVMIITSLGGIIGYIINGTGVAGRLPYSVGYIDPVSWILLAVPAAVMAQFGAAAANHISQRWLTYLFVLLSLYVGLDMIGVFRWLGWNF